MEVKATEKETRSVNTIADGTVIDHITPGQAMNIFHALRMDDEEVRVLIGILLKSHSLGKKDIIKIEERKFTEKEMQQIALFSPQSTISIIENHEVVSKYRVTFPEAIEKIILCPNENCITHEETSQSHFSISQYCNEILLQCRYCEHTFGRDAIQFVWSCGTEKSKR